MNLVSVERAHLRYAEKVVLDGVSVGIDEGDRVGVIGRNGSGKSTLLRVLAGVQPLDDGVVTHARRVTVQLVPQEPDLPSNRSALDVVLHADSEPGRIFRGHRERPNDPVLTTLMDTRGLWDLEHVARGMLDRFAVAADRTVGQLSGGQRMRVALARGLVHADVAARTGDTVPLLILDEPTNHLDLDAIEWLEDRIQSQRGAVVLVTHDRYLLDRVATRIVEVVDDDLRTEHGSYADYLANRAERAQQAAARQHRRRQRVRAELDWLQRSPPARTSKSRARIERAGQLLADEPEAAGPAVRIDLPARRLGSRVVTLHNVGKRYGGTVVLRDVTVNLEPGTRIGVVGPNGSGKTTLLQLIAGRLEPDRGSVRLGSTVHVGRYDQHTAAPPTGQRVIDAVTDVVLETSTVNGITLSASGLLERFGFTPAAQQARVAELSGGERRRLELLRVLATAPNVRLLDEPTNDLDLDTLAVVEGASRPGRASCWSPPTTASSSTGCAASCGRSNRTAPCASTPAAGGPTTRGARPRPPTSAQHAPGRTSRPGGPAVCGRAGCPTTSSVSCVRSNGGCRSSNSGATRCTPSCWLPPTTTSARARWPGTSTRSLPGSTAPRPDVELQLRTDPTS